MDTIDPRALTTEAGRQAWLLARRQGLGSSDAAAICNLSPWSTPLQVYLEKIGELEDQDSSAKKSGRLLEHVIAELYSEETGRQCWFPKSAILLHLLHPWMLASLDRETLVDGEPRIVECKNVGHDSDDWGEAGTDEVPDHYNLQVQHQLAVTGYSACDLAAWFGGQKLRVYTIGRNNRLIATLTGVEQDFWEQVQARRPPDPTYEHPSTLELIRNLYGLDEALSIDLPGTEALSTATLYLGACKDLKEAQKQKDWAKARLLDLMGPAARATLSSGFTLKRKRVTRRGYTAEPTSYITLTVRED